MWHMAFNLLQYWVKMCVCGALVLNKGQNWGQKWVKIEGSKPTGTEMGF